MLSGPPVSAQDYVNIVHEDDVGVFPTVSDSFPGIIGAYYNLPSDCWGPNYGRYLSISFEEEDDYYQDPLDLFSMGLGYEDLSSGKTSGKVYFYMPVVPGIYTLRAYRANPDPNANLNNLYNYGYTTVYDPYSDIFCADYYVQEGPATFGGMPASVNPGGSLAVSVRNISSPLSWVGIFPENAKTFEDCIYSQPSGGQSGMIYKYLPPDIEAGRYCLKVVSYILGNIYISTSPYFEVTGEGAGSLLPDDLLPTVTPTYNVNLENLLPKRITLSVQNNGASNRLAWNAGTLSDGISGYYVYRSTRPGEQTDTPETDDLIKDMTYSDTEIMPGITYYYIVKPVYSDNSIGTASNEVSVTVKGSASENAGTTVFTIGDSFMNINGVKEEIDPGYGTAPVIKDGRTFIPIRALIEEMGGTIEWTGNEKKLTISLNGTTIELWVGRNTIRVDGVSQSIDAAPYISKTGRTMLPLRFVAANLNCDITWDNITKTATISGYGIGDTPEVLNETNSPTLAPSILSGIPKAISSPSIANLQMLKDDSGVPYFRMEVVIHESILTLDQVRPSDGWVEMETWKKVDGDDWIPDGGGLEAFMQEPVPGKTGVYYITFDTIDEGGLGEVLINSKEYTFKTRFYYTYSTGEDYEYVYSQWSNELSGQSERYYESFDE